jgi:glycosyltransferase involved in cell wall biosynthesis
MANKLILTQIMKNESHVAERMLNSIKPMVDGICIIDTGSTDDSIEIVKKWGRNNGVETYVFERPFDNFENSRNYSIEKAREMFLTVDNRNTYYGFWIDFDEQMVINTDFNKSKINKDIYMFTTFIGNMKYTRNELYRLDKPFRFYGPVHEFLVCDDKNITSDIMPGLHINVSMDGASWKGNVAEKYKSHAYELEKYLDKNRKDPRWIFYAAQSWHDAACTDNIEENEERLRRALKYYRERVDRKDGYSEEITYSQYKIGMLMLRLEEPWYRIHQELLKAYSMEPLKGEAVKAIIDYYIHVGEWQNAYLYTKFARSNYHGKNPYPKKVLFIDQTLYEWKFLEAHSAACFYTGRYDEAKANFSELITISKRSPELFGENDLNKIEMNKGFFLK